MKRILSCVVLLTFFVITSVSAEEYDLETYLALVRRNNPDLLLRFKDIELAGTDVVMARSALLPRAGVQGGYNRNLTERTQDMAVPAGGGSVAWREDVRTNFDNELTMGVGISQVLFNAGAISNYQKAKLGRAIREQSFEAARQVVLCAAKKLYARVELALLVVEIRESSENFSLEQYQSVERLRQAGVATDMDLLQSEVDWRSKTDAVMEAK